MNNQITMPDLNAPIIPSVSAAGFKLGLSLREFLAQAKFVEISDDERSEIIMGTNLWRIFYQDFRPFNSSSWHLKDIYAYWNDSVILRFDGNDYPMQRLKVITVKGSYKGRVLNIFGIGDKLDIVAKNYDILFDNIEDCHVLAIKKNIDNHEHDFYYPAPTVEMNQSWENRELIDGLEIGTDCMTAYSLEYPDQVIEQITIVKSQC